MIRNCDCHCNMASWIKSPWIEELLATGSLETPLTRTLRGQVLEIKEAPSERNGFMACAFISDKKFYVKAIFSAESLRNFSSKNYGSSIVSLKGCLICIARYKLVPSLTHLQSHSEIELHIDKFDSPGGEPSTPFGDELLYASKQRSIVKRIHRLWKQHQMRTMYGSEQLTKCFQKSLRHCFVDNAQREALDKIKEWQPNYKRFASSLSLISTLTSSSSRSKCKETVVKEGSETMVSSKEGMQSKSVTKDVSGCGVISVNIPSEREESGSQKLTKLDTGRYRSAAGNLSEDSWGDSPFLIARNEEPSATTVPSQQNKAVRYRHESAQKISDITEGVSANKLLLDKDVLFPETATKRSRKTTDKVIQWGHIPIKDFNNSEKLSPLKRSPTEAGRPVVLGTKPHEYTVDQANLTNAEIQSEATISSEQILRGRHSLANEQRVSKDERVDSNSVLQDAQEDVVEASRKSNNSNKSEHLESSQMSLSQMADLLLQSQPNSQTQNAQERTNDDEVHIVTENVVSSLKRTKTEHRVQLTEHKPNKYSESKERSLWRKTLTLSTNDSVADVNKSGISPKKENVLLIDSQLETLCQFGNKSQASENPQKKRKVEKEVETDALDSRKSYVTEDIGFSQSLLTPAESNLSDLYHGKQPDLVLDTQTTTSSQESSKGNDTENDLDVTPVSPVKERCSHMEMDTEDFESQEKQNEDEFENGAKINHREDSTKQEWPSKRTKDFILDYGEKPKKIDLTDFSIFSKLWSKR